MAMSRIGLRPAKPVLKTVGSRSIGTPKPQPTPYRQTSHVRLSVASPWAPPRPDVDQVADDLSSDLQDRQECITVIGITSGLSSERQQRCLECAAGCRCSRHRVRGSRIDRPRAPRNALLDHERSASPVSGIPASSGRTIRHSLHRGGNRQLNRPLYTIAITQIRGDTEGRA